MLRNKSVELLLLLLYYYRSLFNRYTCTEFYDLLQLLLSLGADSGERERVQMP